MAAADDRFPMATLVDPHPYGYLYAGAAVDPPRHAPLVPDSSARTTLLDRWKATCRQLEGLPEVVSATAYRARVIPPLDGVPRHDALLLIRTVSPEATPAVRESAAFGRLGADSVLHARNTRRIGDTDSTHSATFLFNHFTAVDPGRAVAVWETLTGWYTTKIGVDNSTVLEPVGDTPYAFINYVRLPHGPVRFLLDQFTTPTFYSFVRARLSANDMRALPLLCEPV